MKYLIIDERMREVEKETLEKLGYKLVTVKKNNSVYEEISSHVDIFASKIGEKVIIEKSQLENIKSQLPKECKLIKEGADFVGGRYPDDIKYNICIIGKIALHNFKYTDSKIKQELAKNKFDLINVKQGYTNCSIAIIDENTIITSDSGLNKSLSNKNVDILLLDYTPDIKLYKNNTYSTKNGFIGGAISRVGDDIIVFGDLNIIDKDQMIRNFIQKRNLKIIDFKGLDVIDYGGMLEIDVS